ncbi:MAG TPA: hypothetical protein VFM69_15825 [Pricia sp.]|nr:hypothetical protein [Pricia sp.]
MISANEYWKSKFGEYPQTDPEKLAVVMMAEYYNESAAPELLEALSDFVNNLETWIETGVPADSETSKKLYENAKKAISKALGKQ